MADAPAEHSREAEATERHARRAKLRMAALEEKRAAALAAGFDPDKYAGQSVEELEKLSYQKQGAPRAERQAIRVALDMAIAAQSVEARGLSEDERSIIVQAESLKAKGKAKK